MATVSAMESVGAADVPEHRRENLRRSFASINSTGFGTWMKSPGRTPVTPAAQKVSRQSYHVDDPNHTRWKMAGKAANPGLPAQGQLTKSQETAFESEALAATKQAARIPTPKSMQATPVRLNSGPIIHGEDESTSAASASEQTSPMKFTSSC